MVFFKLYTPPKGSIPNQNLDLYYQGRPLYSTAVFSADRYVFQLPLNLRDKMINGNMHADFHFVCGQHGETRNSSMPDALILSDRYD